jgi:hypothetical protein
MIGRQHFDRAAAAAVLLGATLGGCSVYDRSYSYSPLPVEVRTILAEPEESPVRTLATVIGVRRRSEEDRLPASVEVRLRVENGSTFEVVFDPASLRLVASNVEAFPTPILEPEDVLHVAPGEDAIISAYFPFPEDRYPGPFDLTGLNLEWILQVGEVTRTQSATFHRVRYDPYYYHYHPYHPRYGHYGYPY